MALQLAGAVAMAAALPLAVALWVSGWAPGSNVVAFAWLGVALWAGSGLFWNGRAKLGPAIANLVLGLAAGAFLLISWNDDAHLVRWLAVSVSLVSAVPLLLRPLAPTRLVATRPNP